MAPAGAAPTNANNAAVPAPPAPQPEHLVALPGEKKEHVEALCKMDDEYLEVENAMAKEIAELQAKFNKQVAPMIEKRRAKLAEASLPFFWRHVLQHSLIGELIEEHDEPVLDSLQDMTIEPNEDLDTGYKVHFYFAENEFFTNKVLTKTYQLERTSKWDPDLEAKKIDSTKVDWKKGKDVTLREKTKGKGKKKKTVRVPQQSFFRFFYPLSEDGEMPPTVEDEDEDDEEEEPDMDDLIQEDYMTAQTLKMLIVPHAVRHYTGEACEEEDDDEDDEDDDDEDEDDEETEESDEDDTPPAKKSPKKKSPGKAQMQ